MERKRAARAFEQSLLQFSEKQRLPAAVLATHLVRTMSLVISMSGRALPTPERVRAARWAAARRATGRMGRSRSRDLGSVGSNGRVGSNGCPVRWEMQSRDLATSRDHGRSRGLPSGDAIS